MTRRGRAARAGIDSRLNPRSCAASSMTGPRGGGRYRGTRRLNPRSCAASSMTVACLRAHQRACHGLNPRSCAASSMTQPSPMKPSTGQPSQSAFVRGFIDDRTWISRPRRPKTSLNPRSCAASSMTCVGRGTSPRRRGRLNPRSCAASSMTPRTWGRARRSCAVSIRVRARLHR